jgi:hypothetical protein
MFLSKRSKEAPVECILKYGELFMKLFTVVRWSCNAPGLQKLEAHPPHRSERISMAILYLTYIWKDELQSPGSQKL